MEENLKRWNLPGLLMALAQLATGLAFGMGPPARPPLPNLDNRETAAGGVIRPALAQQAATAKLEGQVPGVRVDWDATLAAPGWVGSARGFLSGPGGEGGGISRAAAAAVPRADPHRAIKAFLNQHSGVFGHNAAVLGTARIAREFVDPRNGLRTVVWQQHYDNLPIFEAILAGHISRKGELVNLSSRFVPEPEAAADRGTPGRAAQRAAPTIPAPQAIVNAARAIEEVLDLDQILALPARPQDAAEMLRYRAAPALSGELSARLVWLPLSLARLRLCWEIVLTARHRGEMFRVIIDATNGDVLIRHCLTHYLGDATFRVYPSDSPSPFSPGHPLPLTNQPPLVPRALLRLAALNTNASPSGWINDGANETLGNNVDAHLDRDGDDAPDLPRPHGAPGRVFDFPLDLTRGPETYGDASVVQLFYWCNWMHDKLYELGFTEAAGNFQVSNFGRGGLGDDPLLADAQDGGGFDNANMSTPPDGLSPRMQMYLFSSPEPHRDGSLDAEIVLHEYTHGLSNRRVGGGVGITALQSAGMGEGWSDFYALSLLSEATDDIHGTYAAAAYAAFHLGGLEENYYFGIRRYPYSTDLGRNPLTFRDIDPSQATTHAGIPRNPAIGSSSAAEVHSQGEVWCVTLWDARANLILKHGFEAGNRLILQLVTDGMNLSPANPNFLQARDAILQADLVDNEGANLPELWLAFAKRGMGENATSPPSSTTVGVGEDFSPPDTLRIFPVEAVAASGPVGGPFHPPLWIYSLSNASAGPLSWSGTNSIPWLSLSSAAGVLAPNTAPALVSATLEPVASLLPAGVYTNRLFFLNPDTGRLHTRDAILRIAQPDWLTETFGRTTNDLSFQTLTFTPDGSSSFYSVCREPAALFPSDPEGGELLPLDDDDFVTITLPETTPISLYGSTTNVFHVGSNGYLTLGEGDLDYASSAPAHFRLPRISALFDDLAAERGVVSWKQFEDRVAITFLNVPEFNTDNGNSFQVELLFTGVIRITWLRIDAAAGLAGLSRGSGVPPGFFNSDLTSYPGCASPALIVILPAAATEGAGVLPAQGEVRLASVALSNITVTLISSDLSELAVPASVTVAAGQTNAYFELTIPNDSLADGTRRPAVTASAPGYLPGAASMFVYDDERASLSVRLPAQVMEGAGTVQGMISISPPPSEPVVVTLSSSDPTELQVPAYVIVPATTAPTLNHKSDRETDKKETNAGQSGEAEHSTEVDDGPREILVPFDALVIDDTKIDGPRHVRVRAAVAHWRSRSTVVKVLDDEDTMLRVAVRSRISEAAGRVAAAGLVQLSGTLPTNLVVFLTSSDPLRLEVTASVTIIAGQTATPFELTAVDNPSADGPRLITVTARANGWQPGSGVVSVADDETPLEPSLPSPPHLATNVPLDVTLSWSSGSGELVVNGGFETGDFTGWRQETVGSGSFIINDGTVLPPSGDEKLPPLSGSFSALSVQTGPGHHTLFQDIAIPATATSAILSWSDRIRNHAGEFASNQSFRVEVRSLSNTVRQVLFATRPGDPLTNNWVSRSFDLSLYIGQTIRLAFAEEDGLYYFNIHLDEVSLNAGSPAPSIYEVYFGTGPSLGPAQFQGNTTNTSWRLAQLNLDTAYFWKVIARGALADAAGPVWQFTTRGVGPLHHFEWSPVAAVQYVDQPFPVTLTARDDIHNLVTHFTGLVDLSGFIPPRPPGLLAGDLDQGEVHGSVAGGTETVAITPARTDPFTNGAWQGLVTVRQVAGNMSLLAEDGQGHSGTANEFSVVHANDLAVELSVAPDVVSIGYPVAFMITVTNTGPADGTRVAVTDVLPPGLDLVSVQASRGSCLTSNGRITCDLGTLAGGTYATINLLVRPRALGVLSNVVTVSRGEPDAFLANNTASALVQVQTPALSIDDVSIREGDDGLVNALFTVRLAPASTNVVLVRFATSAGSSNSATAGIDYDAANGLLVFAPGEAMNHLSVAVRGDRFHEADELFALRLSSPTNAILGKALGIGRILNDDPLPTLVIADARVVEGNSGKNTAVFRLSLSAPSSQSIQVTYFTLDDSATAPGDYEEVLFSQVEFNPGQTNQNISVVIQADTLNEPDETFFVLFFANGAQVPKPFAFGTIVNDDFLPTIAAAGSRLTLEACPNHAIDPGENVTVECTLRNLSMGGAITDQLVATLLPGGGIIDPSEPRNYGAIPRAGFVSRPFTFKAGGTCGAVLNARLRLRDGTNDLGTVSFPLDLGQPLVTFVENFDGVTPPALPPGWSGSWNGSGAPWTTVSNLSDSPPHSVFAPDPDRSSDNQLTSPAISITSSNARIAFSHRYSTESCCDSGSLEVSIGNGAFQDILTAGGGFLAHGYTDERAGWRGTSPGFVRTVASLPSRAAGQQVQLRWHFQSDSSVGDTGWHVDSVSVQDGSECCYTDDLAVRIQDSPDPAGLGGIITYTISVTNTGPSIATVVGLTNVLPATTGFLSATSSHGSCENRNNTVVCALGDLPGGAQAGVTISATATALGRITNLVQVSRAEPDVDTSNNRASAVTTVRIPTITFNDTSVVEGDIGTTNAVFTLNLAPASTNTVSVSFTTFDNVGGAGVDYIATNGVLSFAPGQTEASLAIAIVGDLADEPDEQFFIRLSRVVNGQLGRTLGIFTIIDDDPAPVVSVADAALDEGNRGTNRMVFRVSLSRPSGRNISVGYATRDGTATTPEDYLPASGLILFKPGETSADITVMVRGDLTIEPDETFSFSISNVVNAVLGRAQAAGRIVNDDGRPGQIHHFTWDAIPSPQYLNEPFTVRITARDGLNQVASQFTGTVPLSATRLGDLATNDILGGVAHLSSGSGSDFTLGYAFTPDKTLTVTHLRHYFGQRVSIWTDQGILLVTRAVNSAPGTWLETPLDTPIRLEAGVRYRVAAYAATANSWFLAQATNGVFPDGTIDEGYSASGQAFPTGSSSLAWMVSLRYTYEPSPQLNLAPVQAAGFTGGSWTGSLSVGDAGRRVRLAVADLDGHAGTSDPFDVHLAGDLTLQASVSPATVLTNSQVTWQLTVFNPGPGPASDVRLANSLPAGLTLLSASASQGGCAAQGGRVVCQLGSIMPLSNAVVSLVATTPATPGYFTNLATVSAVEPDWNPANNTAVAITTVTVPPLPPGTGAGLAGEYFDNENFSGASVTRIDPVMNLDFSRFAPAPGISPFPFSARWSGSIQPRVTGMFTLHIVSAEGARVWCQDQLIVDSWVSHSAREDRASLALSAGELYPVFIELYESVVPALLSLTWTPPNQPHEIIPQTQLYPFARPMLLVPPAPQAVRQGTAVTFSAFAVGSPPLSYQWRLAGTNLPGATGTNWIVNEASDSAAGDYSVVVTNSYGSVTSAVASLSITTPPAFTLQPQSQTATVGGTVTFTVRVSGTPPFGYRWRAGGRTVVPFGVGGPSLTLNNVQLTNAGNYSVIVTNAANTNGALSFTAVLTVLADRDGDRIPDSWENAYGLDPNDPSDAAADRDGDGLTNLQEYLSGTNPTNAASSLRLQILNGGNGTAVLRFISMSNISYSIDYSPTLAPPDWRPLSDILPRTGTNTVEFRDPAAGGDRSRFYRLITPRHP